MYTCTHQCTPAHTHTSIACSGPGSPINHVWVAWSWKPHVSPHTVLQCSLTQLNVVNGECWKYQHICTTSWGIIPHAGRVLHKCFWHQSRRQLILLRISAVHFFMDRGMWEGCVECLCWSVHHWKWLGRERKGGWAEQSRHTHLLYKSAIGFIRKYSGEGMRGEGRTGGGEG